MKKIDKEFFSRTPGLFSYKKCVFIVGAGISVPSGIPDFRSPDGIFSTLKKQLKIDGNIFFTFHFGIKEETRGIYLKYIADLKRLCDKSQPNEMHRFLASFPRSRTYTQNIDGLEERAGMQFKRDGKTKGVYLHGNLGLIVCRYCGWKDGFTEHALKVFEEGKEVECFKCLDRRAAVEKQRKRKGVVGLMHPGIIHYHQAHPDGPMISRLVEMDSDCDMLIVVGTSLRVDGIKKVVRFFSKCPGVTGRRILVNKTAPTKEWNGVFDYFFEGDCLDFIEQYQREKNKSKTKEERTLTHEEIISKINNIGKKVSVLIPLRRLSLQEESEEVKVKSKKNEETGMMGRLAKISEMFDSPDLIKQPVLDDALRETAPEKIKRSSISEAEYVANSSKIQ